MAITRRHFLLGATGFAALAASGFVLRPGQATRAAEGTFEVNFTEAEWREQLSPEAFTVLREHGTERPYTSPLNEESRTGTFVCAGCELPLFTSDTKYDSRTGWPSFYDFIPGSLGTSVDTSYFMTRTEVHCSRCGGHQGHVFEDGPPPTGLRYCINGVSLRFVAA